METEDALKPVSQRKVALRELPNGSRNITVQFPSDAATFKDRSFNTECPKICGIKRSHPDCSLKPENLPSCGIDIDIQPEPQRRKTEEPCKVSTKIYSPIDTTLNHHSYADERSKPKDDGQQESAKAITSFSTFIPVPINSVVSSNSSSAAYSLGSPVTGFPVTVHNYSSVNAGIPVNSHVSKLHWKERFLQLQAFLKAYDQSSQEDYIQMLRSLSSAGRSKHAVELEKRAIQLLIEEGRELSRMKVLNVLGKGLPVNQMPYPIQVAPSIPPTKEK